MPTPTSFSPKTIDEFNVQSLNYNGYGVTAVIDANTTTNLDLTFASDDMMLTSIELVVTDPQPGDYMRLSVVHPILLVELNVFVPRWYLGTQSFRNFYEVRYPSKLIAGLILRGSYVSVNGVAPTFVAVNYGLHKVLW